ncbi:NAD(P)H-binding protein [Micromonospora humi]|uniref:Saccharopine dehydrogenase NADP binding domain-containing protein n=1 Tax=Micromonospora humi TaxID=745366 RepID=A0A1C5H0Z0_9ACTN|nr:NAD(P)H-binding protein [Micromonospora humi]SCG39706.1 Saccharopine dehydrogenase NADP binding domain-containing protein [Micromonospora humi]
MSGTIALVGASGGVGRHALAHLLAWTVDTVRAGSRDPRRVPAGDPRVQARPVDLTDRGSLDAFCAGCHTVVNCAGPAVTVGDTVGRAAARAGAAYVDAAGDDGLYRAVAALPGAAGRVAVISAGMMPGLSGLLPAYLAGRLPGARRLTGWVGGRDGFSPGAAWDFLAVGEGGYGEPLAAWRDGARRSRVLAAQVGVAVPFFDEPVLLQPYLSTETERLAGRLGLTDVDWWSAFAGSRVPAALADGARRASASRAGPVGAAGLAGPADLADAVDALCRAAELDAFGRPRYQVLLVELTGPTGSRVLACRGTGANALTGAAVALGAVAAAAGDLPPGVHHLAEVVDPTWAVDRLRSSPAVTALHVEDGPLARYEPIEEGVA